MAAKKSNENGEIKVDRGCGTASTLKVDWKLERTSKRAI
jgi:hypothetical protein